ncbi:hypothetical protein [Photobacterium kishitanii]|uniref:Uncharacterized protein n=1 Tax=Photobacterium kishitanii TaxID=318456 RepID=A0A2T3KLD7_9GAMM|nr:hypothetical protein [Photobacterium kishitanii]PSV00457.1 hypothetical protein C9J27_04815 [Photobacterium kishitanii]
MSLYASTLDRIQDLIVLMIDISNEFNGTRQGFLEDAEQVKKLLDENYPNTPIVGKLIINKVGAANVSVEFRIGSTKGSIVLIGRCSTNLPNKTSTRFKTSVKATAIKHIKKFISSMGYNKSSNGNESARSHSVQNHDCSEFESIRTLMLEFSTLAGEEIDISKVETVRRLSKQGFCAKKSEVSIDVETSSGHVITFMRGGIKLSIIGKDYLFADAQKAVILFNKIVQLVD